MKREKRNQPQYGAGNTAPQWFMEPGYETNQGLYPTFDPPSYGQASAGGMNFPNNAGPGYNFGGGMGGGSDYSGFPNAPSMFTPIAQQFLNDPQMTGMALQYGGNMVEQGAHMVQQKVEHWMSLSRLKYYFAVDNTYVGKKLLIILFPFLHKDWTVKYDQQSEPVAPRDDVNAPDLYIPTLSFVTYVLLSGLIMGTQSRFSPDRLGLQTSSTLGWLMLEVLILMLVRYFLQVQSSLRYLDVLAYSGYKFIGMIMCLLGGLFLSTLGYYGALMWSSVTLAFFLIKTLRLQIQPHTSHHAEMLHGNKRRTYLLLFIACIQPFFIWLLTKSIVFSPTV